MTEEEIKRIRHLAAMIYGEGVSITSGNIGHHKIPIIRQSEEICKIIDKHYEATGQRNPFINLIIRKPSYF